MTPEDGTVERWAWDYVTAIDLASKLCPPAPPPSWAGARDAPVRLCAPGRPPELRVAPRAEKTRGLMAPSGRARALHTFFHHELQAAELMAWAILAFPDAPAEFREGLLRIAQDEIRHMKLYADQIERLGHRVGDFPVRDWFWLRVPTCRDPASFVAVMGLGLESANLEHSATFAARFRQAGDEEGARVQELVGREEIAHVRFGVRWFERFARPRPGDEEPRDDESRRDDEAKLDFDAWRRALPPPLTPLLMRGKPIDRAARRRAGQPERFIDALDAWTEPTEPTDAPSEPSATVPTSPSSS